MLKELFEGYFYYTFPKVGDKLLMLDERMESGDFSLLDLNACRSCRFVCNEDPEMREQLRVNGMGDVCIISMDQVFRYVKEDVGETCDYMMEGYEDVMLVEMSCSMTDYVSDKRQKARRQLYNTLSHLYMNPLVKVHIEKKMRRSAIFSWKETSYVSGATDMAESSMLGMMLMPDEVYSPDNESKFEFGFVLKEIRYPDVLVCA